MSPITITYRTTRADLWIFYWQQWRSRLWKYWLLIGAAALAYYLFRLNMAHRAFSAANIAIGAAIAFAAVIWLPLVPQIMFKPRTRSLTVGPQGIETQIDEVSGNRAWGEIGAIDDDGKYIHIIVAATMNAFVIPQRAFAAPADRETFLTAIRQWRAAAMSAD
jgi:hypothetical protein